MKQYMNIDTGVIWSEEEIRAEYNNFREESEYMKEFDSFEEYLEDQIDKGILEEAPVLKSGKAFSFEYDGICFTFTIIGNYCECFADEHFQWGFELGQDGHTESPDEIANNLIGNYENGNIILEDEDEDI